MLDFDEIPSERYHENTHLLSMKNWKSVVVSNTKINMPRVVVKKQSNPLVFQKGHLKISDELKFKEEVQELGITRMSSRLAEKLTLFSLGVSSKARKSRDISLNINASIEPSLIIDHHHYKRSINHDLADTKITNLMVPSQHLAQKRKNSVGNSRIRSYLDMAIKASEMDAFYESRKKPRRRKRYFSKKYNNSGTSSKNTKRRSRHLVSQKRWINAVEVVQPTIEPIFTSMRLLTMSDIPPCE